MSNEDVQRWREKYLKSIEQQEKLQRRWDARLDLLRRGLVRSTLAAEGTDRAVDQCMKEMREVVRSDEMDGPLAALLPRLEKAVLDSEQRRETRVEQVSTALNALVSQLQSLPLPSEVRRPLKKFAKQLDDRVSQAREIPLLLGELSGLQGQALSTLQAPAEPARPGLLQRLFGGRDDEDPGEQPQAASDPVAQHADESPPASTVEHAPPHVHPAASEVAPAPAPTEQPVPVEPPPVAAVSAPAKPSIESQEPSPAEVTAYVPPVIVPAPTPVEAASHDELQAIPTSSELDPLPAAQPADSPDTLITDPPHSPAVFLDTLPLPQTMAEALAAVDPECPDEHLLYALPTSPEPSYSSVASHIEATLLGLLNDLDLPERHRPQAEAMRQRLEHGLNWYELLPILDDLAVLMLAITDSGQHEFEVYLQQLNERLESFQSHLQAASAGHAEGRSAANELHSQLREHVDGLQSSVQDAADLDSLKHILESRLEGLLGTMDQHQQQRDQREQEVAARLQGLAERVASMEQEAQGYREHLEEQRQKALIDPLTGLPNRAAWSERLETEIAHWQQHGNSLLIAMLDLDHFKRINDSYGHLAGDKVLKIIAGELRKRLRPTDFIARFGGEEFVLLIPDTALPMGLKLVEKLRAAIEACPFHFKGEPVTVTVSVGISAFKSGERCEQVLKRADQALYRAKDAGRNRIEVG